MGALNYVITGSGCRASGRGGTSRRRPRFHMQLQRSYGIGLWHCLALVVILVLHGWQGRRPDWFVFGLCEGRPGCYVGAAALKAWCLGGDLEICVDSEYVGPTSSSSGNARSFWLVRQCGGPGVGGVFIAWVVVLCG
jgi:hypothetical protein